MTKDQIIEEIWKMPFLDVLKVAMVDDFILLCKAWPAIAAAAGVCLIAGMAIEIYKSYTRRR